MYLYLWNTHTGKNILRIEIGFSVFFFNKKKSHIAQHHKKILFGIQAAYFPFFQLNILNSAKFSEKNCLKPIPSRQNEK